MSQPDFSEYVNNICKGIKSRPMREDIMEELTTHLEDNYERNLAVGMTEDEARLDAMKKMGDGELLSYYLSEVHSRSPIKEMNSTLVQVILGFVCMNFIFSGTFKEIIVILGIILMFSPLLRLRKINGKAEKAFHFFNFFALTQLFYYCISIGSILPLWTANIYFVVNALFKGLFWFFLFSSLNETCEKHLGEESKKPKLVLCGAFYMILSFITGGVLILTEGETITINDFIAPIVLIFMFIYTVVQLVRTKNILWNADSEYGILPADKKHFTVYTCVLSVCVATVLIFNYASSTQKPVKTELVIHDVSVEEQSEADKIRHKMLDWDVQPQIVEDLPDSEILKYKDAAFVTWGAEGGSMWNGSSGVNSTVWYYCFFFPDEGNYSYPFDARLLCYIESDYSDKIKSFYRKGFYYAPWDNILPLNTGEGLNDSFISIVTDEKGKKYNAEPFYTYNLGDDYALEWPKGFEYKEEKGQRVYYAANISIQTFAENVTIHTDTLRKRSFLNFKYYTTADFAETILDYGNVISRGEGLFPYSWKEHPLFIWNADNMENEENIKKLIGKSKEMK